MDENLKHHWYDVEIAHLGQKAWRRYPRPGDVHTDHGGPHRRALRVSTRDSVRRHVRERTRKWSDIDFLVVLTNGSDQHHAAVEIHRTLGDLPVAKDTVVTTPEEIGRRGHVVGGVLYAALRDGKTIYERP